MTTTYPSRTISVRIERPPAEVYAVASDPERMAQWASGLGESFRREGEVWVVQTPQGQASVRFAARNDLGVLDHYVTLATGEQVYVPMRVLPNGPGSEVFLTLFRAPGVSEDAFAADVEWVERDLAALKALLEG